MFKSSGFYFFILFMVCYFIYNTLSWSCVQAFVTRDRSAGSCFIEGAGNSNANATAQRDIQVGSRALCSHRPGSSALAEDRHWGHILGSLVGCVLDTIFQDGENMSITLGSLVQAFTCHFMKNDFGNISFSSGHRPGELGGLTSVFVGAVFRAGLRARAPTVCNEYLLLPKFL